MPDLSTITPVTREEEFLDRIARAAASPNLPEVDASDNGDVLTVVSGEWAAAAPASDLPEVTSSNNGQVLTVVSGEWAAAAAPAGGGVLMVTMTVSESGGEWTVSNVSESVTDIYSAATNGTPVFADISGLVRTAAHFVVPLSNYLLENGEKSVQFNPCYQEVVDGAYSAIHYVIGGFNSADTDEWDMYAETSI